MTPRYFIVAAAIGGSSIQDDHGAPLVSFGNDSCGLHLRSLLLAGLEREGHAVIEKETGRYLAGARLDQPPPVGLTVDDPTAVPDDFEVQPIEFQSAEYHDARVRGALAQCGTCNRMWDDAEPTSYTPAPAGRCPFEYFHAPKPVALNPIEFVVAYGGPTIGYRLFGPFPSEEQAADWGEVMGEGGDVVMEVYRPADAIAVGLYAN